MKKFLSVVFASSALFVMGCADPSNPVSEMNATDALSRSAGLADSSVVTLVQGVPGGTFDVFVNGSQLLSGFTFGTITDPMRFAEGMYWLVIARSTSGDTLFADSVALPGNINVSVVAHLTSTGTPTLSAFLNDMSPVVPGKGRLVVRHAAEAPAVDVMLYRGARLNNFFGSMDSLANSQQAQMDIRPGRYTATINPSGTSTVILGPATIQLRPHEAYILYAVGSANAGGFTLLLQRMNLSHESAQLAIE